RTDDIRTIYHPSSNKATTTEHWNDYNPGYGHTALDMAVNWSPWAPFRNRRDFEISSLPVHSLLSSGRIDDYIRSYHTGPFGRDPGISASDFASWKRTMDAMAALWFRDIWDWLSELMDDPSIGPKMEWDAVQLWRYDGKTWYRFYHEPWTADGFWKRQDQVPPDGKVLAVQIYADKTRLSSFAGVQGYPVIGRVLNIPVTTRNGRGVGSGELLAWLPFPDHNPQVSAPVWALHKRRVWHAAMGVLLKPFADASESGIYRIMAAYNNEVWRIYPTILTLSADLEEQSVMGLTRGSTANKPCPVCMADKATQHHFIDNVPRRNSTDTKDRYVKAQDISNKKERDKFFQKYGERDMENCFWVIDGFDVYCALQFDRLHVCHDGLLGQHFLPSFVYHIHLLERKTPKVPLNMYYRLVAFPRWRDMTHFVSGFTNMTFNDGTKFLHVMTQVNYTLPSILTPTADLAGYTLLRAHRHFLEFDMFIGMEVHSERTIAAGRRVARRFSDMLQVSANRAKGEKLKPRTKNWAFPKAHMVQHAFDDVEDAGASRNNNTKHGEKMHGSFKNIYQRTTNFKDVEEQILRMDRYQHGVNVIKEEIDLYDAQMAAIVQILSGDEQAQGTEGLVDSAVDTHVSVQSPEGNGAGITTLSGLSNDFPKDAAFVGFAAKLNACVRLLFEDSTLSFSANDTVSAQLCLPISHFSNHAQQIQRYASMKVNYEHEVDGRTAVDYLKCTPLFYRHPRYDCGLFHDEMGVFFARLVMIFSANVAGSEGPVLLALVHPYTQRPKSTNIDRDNNKRAAKARRTILTDKELRRYRVRPAPRGESIVVPLRSMIRGAVLVPDFGLLYKDREYLVVDLIDADMFLRMSQIKYIGQTVTHAPY
ncbi:hypothetical protein CYLTODRAFT_469038, partial [Cylindrobasidium torrendii FP15055 ss-10]